MHLFADVGLKFHISTILAVVGVNAGASYLFVNVDAIYVARVAEVYGERMIFPMFRIVRSYKYLTDACFVFVIVMCCYKKPPPTRESGESGACSRGVRRYSQTMKAGTTILDKRVGRAETECLRRGM